MSVRSLLAAALLLGTPALAADTWEVDPRYLQAMKRHHQEKLEWAKLLAEKSPDEEVKARAQEVVEAEQKALERLEKELGDDTPKPAPGQQTL